MEDKFKAPGNERSELPRPAGSDFKVALQNEYDRIIVSIGDACLKSRGDLTAPEVVTMMAKADALDAVCKLWEVKPNPEISRRDLKQTQLKQNMENQEENVNTETGGDGLDCEQRFVRQDFEDLWYTVIAEPHSHHVDYKVYAIEGVGGDSGEQMFWHKKDDPCSPSPVETLEEAEVFLHGFVKWDGCSNWYFDEQDRAMIHGCEREHLTNIGEIMAKCWDMTKGLCPHWCDM